MTKVLRLLLLIGINLMMFSMSLKSQCPGSWSGSPTLNYLCANGPFLQQDLGVNVCPTVSQATYTFTTPVQNIELIFSAFGSMGNTGASRMAVFLNGSIIDLNLACAIVIGCQIPAGTYSVNSGCLVDIIAGADGGISGFMYISAAAFGLASISSIGVAVSEPSSTGTIFEIGSCDTASTININLGNDTTICSGDSVILDAGNSGASYSWSTGESAQTITVDTAGSYWVEVDNGGCIVSDTVNINIDNCATTENTFFIPNSFSPNKDGDNDILFVRGSGIKNVKLFIYNRWGEKVFETYDINKGWDGTYKSRKLNTAVFAWYVEVEFEDGDKVYRKGNVTLIR